MFPPVASKSAQDWIQGLWRSLQRAAPQWAEDATLDEENGEVIVSLYLLQHLPPKTTKVVGKIIRDYAKACGWDVKKMFFNDNYVVFVASKA